MLQGMIFHACNSHQDGIFSHYLTFFLPFFPVLRKLQGKCLPHHPRSDLFLSFKQCYFQRTQFQFPKASYCLKPTDVASSQEMTSSGASHRWCVLLAFILSGSQFNETTCLLLKVTSCSPDVSDT